MATRDYAGQAIQLNDEGYLLDSAQWSPAIAEAIAEEVGIELTPEHWTIIGYCREDAANEGQSPGLRRISKNAGVPMKELYRLFPRGPGKLVARISGLPKPKSCL